MSKPVYVFVHMYMFPCHSPFAIKSEGFVYCVTKGAAVMAAGGLKSFPPTRCSQRPHIPPACTHEHQHLCSSQRGTAPYSDCISSLIGLLCELVVITHIYETYRKKEIEERQHKSECSRSDNFSCSLVIDDRIFITGFSIAFIMLDFKA